MWGILQMADDRQTKPGPSRLWRIVLVGSLALNLAVAGLVVGAAVSGRFGDRPPRSFDFGLGPVALALDPAERRAIGGAMRRDGALRAGDPRRNAAAMVAALRAEPFDPDQLQDLMTAHNNQVATLQRKALAALMDQIIAMSPERRAAFADRLQQELSRGRDRRSGG